MESTQTWLQQWDLQASAGVAKHLHSGLTERPYL